MKKALCKNKYKLFILVLLCISCSSNTPKETQAQMLLQEQITAHYDSLKLEGYHPLSYSAIDTVTIQRNKDGSISVIIGEVTHHFRAIEGDSLLERSQVFEVQIYEDGVDVIPPKDGSEKKESPSISI